MSPAAEGRYSRAACSGPTPSSWAEYSYDDWDAPAMQARPRGSHAALARSARRAQVPRAGGASEHQRPRARPRAPRAPCAALTSVPPLARAGAVRRVRARLGGRRDGCVRRGVAEPHEAARARGCRGPGAAGAHKAARTGPAASLGGRGFDGSCLTGVPASRGPAALTALVPNDAGVLDGALPRGGRGGPGPLRGEPAERPPDGCAACPGVAPGSQNRALLRAPRGSVRRRRAIHSYKGGAGPLRASSRAGARRQGARH